MCWGLHVTPRTVVIHSGMDVQVWCWRRGPTLQVQVEGSSGERVILGGQSAGEWAHRLPLNLEFGGRASDRTEKGTPVLWARDLAGWGCSLKTGQELELKNPDRVTQLEPGLWSWKVDSSAFESRAALMLLCALLSCPTDSPLDGVWRAPASWSCIKGNTGKAMVSRLAQGLQSMYDTPVWPGTGAELHEIKESQQKLNPLWREPSYPSQHRESPSAAKTWFWIRILILGFGFYFIRRVVILYFRLFPLPPHKTCS